MGIFLVLMNMMIFWANSDSINWIRNRTVERSKIGNLPVISTDFVKRLRNNVYFYFLNSSLQCSKFKISFPFICKSTRNPILAIHKQTVPCTVVVLNRGSAPADRSSQSVDSSKRTLPDKKALACPLVSVLQFWHQPKF